jgi:hypothetical protein
MTSVYATGGPAKGVCLQVGVGAHYPHFRPALLTAPRTGCEVDCPSSAAFMVGSRER